VSEICDACLHGLWRPCVDIEKVGSSPLSAAGNLQARQTKGSLDHSFERKTGEGNSTPRVNFGPGHSHRGGIDGLHTCNRERNRRGGRRLRSGGGSKVGERCARSNDRN